MFTHPTSSLSMYCSPMHCVGVTWRYCTENFNLQIFCQ